jgi:hypothetical protein
MKKDGRKSAKMNPRESLSPTSQRLSDYFKEVFLKFEKVELPFVDHLSLAGYTLKLEGSSRELQKIFLPSLAHLKIDENQFGKTDLTIWYADAKGMDSLIPEPPFDDFNGVGFSESASEDGFYIYYQPAFRQVFLYSEEKKLGIYWALNRSTIPWWEPTFSFRIILHWWTKDKPLQLMHAGAAAVDQNGGWLIAGPSGSGKSSTCLTLLEQELLYLGDDYVLVKTDSEPAVFTVYQTAKLEPDNFQSRFSEFANYIQNPDSYLQEKAIFNIYEPFPNSFTAAVPLKGVLLPRVTGKPDSEIVPVSSGKALLGIAPTTLRHLPHFREESYQKMKNLIHQVPVLEWRLGTDKPDLLRSFLELNAAHP